MPTASRWRERTARQTCAPYDYPDLLQAIRDELSPVQGKLEDLTRQVNLLAQGAVTRTDLAEIRQEISAQMLRVETNYYSKDLIEAKLGIIESSFNGLREEFKGLAAQIKDLAQRPSRALSTWVAIITIAAGLLGGLSFFGQHLGLVIH